MSIREIRNESIPIAMSALHWQFYLSPIRAWQAMYHDCTKATQSIVLEQYIFKNDEVGQKFMRLFIHKARQGLKIQLLCDGVGSRTLRHSLIVEQLRGGGGDFQFYHSLKLIDLFKPKMLFPRTHVKTLVVDGCVAYVGGVCINRKMEGWRDTQIRITGPIAQQIKDISDGNFVGTYPDYLIDTSAYSDFIYVQSDPAFFRHPFYSHLMKAIQDARHFIYISTAFFIPTRHMRYLLIRAAARGIKVMILIPHHSDSRIADLACLSYAMRLVKEGIHIFRYQPTILHNKTVVIDEEWGTVGSSNMDALSSFHNREANLIIRNKEALGEMKKDFLNDLRYSHALTIHLLKKLPLWTRIAMQLARLCHSFL